MVLPMIFASLCQSWKTKRLEDLREPGRVREAAEGIQKCEAENEVGVESVTGCCDREDNKRGWDESGGAYKRRDDRNMWCS